MFLGTHRPRLDEKGRLALPARFRDELAEGVVLTKGQDRCLYGYTAAEFTRIGDALRSAPVGSAALRNYQRTFFGSASLEVPDKQGRVTFPARCASTRVSTGTAWSSVPTPASKSGALRLSTNGRRATTPASPNCRRRCCRASL